MDLEGEVLEIRSSSSAHENEDGEGLTASAAGTEGPTRAPSACVWPGALAGLGAPDPWMARGGEPSGLTILVISGGEAAPRVTEAELLGAWNSGGPARPSAGVGVALLL